MRQSKRRGGPKERSQSQLKGMSNVGCYYFGEKRYVQSLFPKLNEDEGNFKKLQERMRRKAKLEDEDDLNANLIDRGDIFWAKSSK